MSAAWLEIIGCCILSSSITWLCTYSAFKVGINRLEHNHVEELKYLHGEVNKYKGWVDNCEEKLDIIRKTYNKTVKHNNKIKNELSKGV